MCEWFARHCHHTVVISRFPSVNPSVHVIVCGAVLTIDGIELPTAGFDKFTVNGVAPKRGVQVELSPTTIFDPGNCIISYQPQEGAPNSEST